MLRKDIRFPEPGPALTQADIEQAIRSLGRGPWPHDYVQFMQRFNGADPVVTTVRPDRLQLVRLWWPVAAAAADFGHHAGLHDMFRLRDDPTERPDLLEVHADLGHRFPPESMAFADCDGGAFLFDLRPDRYGEVLYWCRLQQGDPETQARHPYHNVAWVADSLVDFFNRILEEPDDWDAWAAGLSPDSERDWRP
jgi:hypothetical protein